jgi:hypothetical protein
VSITSKITFKIQQERWHSCLNIRQRPLEAFIKPPQHLPTKLCFKETISLNPPSPTTYKPAHNARFQPFLPPKTNQSFTHCQPYNQLSDASTTQNLTKYICNSYPTVPNKKRYQNPLQQPPLSITAMIVKIQQEHWHYRLIRSQRSLEPFIKPPQHLPTKTMLQRNHFIEPSKS